MVRRSWGIFRQIDFISSKGGINEKIAVLWNLNKTWICHYFLKEGGGGHWLLWFVILSVVTIRQGGGANLKYAWCHPFYRFFFFGIWFSYAWYLKGIFFSIFSVSIWYLIDTKLTLDTQLHPWIRQPFAFLNAGVVLVVVVERSDNVEAQLLLITSLTWRIESNRIETVGEAVLHNSAFLRLLIIKLITILFNYLQINMVRFRFSFLARATETTDFYVSLCPY